MLRALSPAALPFVRGGPGAPAFAGQLRRAGRTTDIPFVDFPLTAKVQRRTLLVYTMEVDMRTMNIKEARGCLSTLVDRAERGETVVITRHGKQSARLCPPQRRAKGLPSLSEFRSRIVPPSTGLAATVMTSRREDRF